MKELYITEVNNLLIITKKFKNGKKYADELSAQGFEEVEVPEYDNNKRDKLIGKGKIVWAVVDKNLGIIKNQTSFYDDKKIAESIVLQMNRSTVEKNKPYKIQRAYLLIPIS